MLFYNKVTNVRRATHLYVYGSRKSKEIIKLNTASEEKQENKGKANDSNTSIQFVDAQTTELSFEYRFTKYYYSETRGMFVPIEFDYYKPYSYLLSNYKNGVEEGAPYDKIVSMYGKCCISLPEKGNFRLLIENVLTPFYLFQIFSITLWYFSEYEIYASCILVTSAVGTTMEMLDIKRNLKKLKLMAYYECPITVKRMNSDGDFVYRDIGSNDLVPGDIMLVPESTKMP